MIILQRDNQYMTGGIIKAHAHTADMSFSAQSWQAWPTLEPIIPALALLFGSVFDPFSHRPLYLLVA